MMGGGTTGEQVTNLKDMREMCVRLCAKATESGKSMMINT